MTGTVSRPRSFLFKNARPMPDGRMLMLQDQSFLILESEELSRLQRWLILSVVIDIVGFAALVTAFVLSEQGAVSEETLWTAIWITIGALLLPVLIFGTIILSTIKNRTRPIEEYSQLQRIWDQGA